MAVPRPWSLSQQSRDQAASASSTVTAIVSSSVVPNAATRARRRAAIRSGAHAVKFGNVRVRTLPPSRKDSHSNMVIRNGRVIHAYNKDTILGDCASDLSHSMPTRVRKHNDHAWFFQSIPENNSGKIRRGQAQIFQTSSIWVSTDGRGCTFMSVDIQCQMKSQPGGEHPTRLDACGI
jgi:hypothetical protein